MDEHPEEGEVQELFPQPVGEQLRAAREAKGLTLQQISDETRIPLRQLQLIDAGDFAAMTGRTYAVGFSRTYARSVGLPEGEIAKLVRAQLEQHEPDKDERGSRYFEPGDPARVPTALLGWISLAAVILLAAGGYAFFRGGLTPAVELPSLLAGDDAAQTAPVADAQIAAEPTPEAGGAVVFTALEDGIWVKFYDAQGRQLMQKQMAKGESYAVPGDADGPQLWTGRPDALAITVGGRDVPKLAERDQIMKDVAVTAEALLGRAAPQTAAEPTA